MAVFIARLPSSSAIFVGLASTGVGGLAAASGFLASNRSTNKSSNYSCGDNRNKAITVLATVVIVMLAVVVAAVAVAALAVVIVVEVVVLTLLGEAAVTALAVVMQCRTMSQHTLCVHGIV
jgi:hypothetical protein